MPWEQEWGLRKWLAPLAGLRRVRVQGGREEVRRCSSGEPTNRLCTAPPAGALSQGLLSSEASLPSSDLGFRPPRSYASLHHRVHPSRWPPFPRPEDFPGRALEPMLSSPHAPEPSGGSSLGHCVLQVLGECQGSTPACT